jgi:long-chain acyl-CoA synthetase
VPNLAANLIRSAAAAPDADAIRLDNLVLSYRDLNLATGRLAHLLRAESIGPGDRVALMLPNVPAFAVVYYAALRTGAVIVPMNPMLRTREIEYYLRDSGARALFAVPGGEAEACAAAAKITFHGVDDRWLDDVVAAQDVDDDVVEREADDVAVILYTSGTTGRPKGAQLTHHNLDRNQHVTATTLLCLNGAEDVIMGCLPLFHVFGMTCGLNAAVAAGATLALVPRFDPARALTTIERFGVTVFEGVPTMYAAMLGAANAQDVDVSSLRLCVSGGSSLPLEILRQFETQFGCAILEGYGLSETSPVASFNHPDRERKPGSIGTPVLGVEMRLVDENGEDVPVGEIGEIVIRGDNVMKGYWNQDEATAQAIRNGWLFTGDLALADKDGYFFIVDRKKDIIIRGGYNVYPREIEEVLYEHPYVTEAAVVGLPDPRLGEEVGACVVLRAGSETTADELVDYVKQRVAAYKYPRRVWFVTELPKGPSGKILKREIRPPVEQRSAPAAALKPESAAGQQV